MRNPRAFAAALLVLIFLVTIAGFSGVIYHGSVKVGMADGVGLTIDDAGAVDTDGAILSAGTVTGTRLISTVATGTAPLTVASTTKVTNLNADLLDGIEASALAGSSAKWTTPRLLAGNSVDGSADVPFSNKFIAQGTADAGLTGAQFMGALGTGIVKNTVTTGVQSIAVAGDFPTLNQSTTGSAATLTTPRAINGTNFDGSAAITVPVNNAVSTTNADMFPLFTATHTGNYPALTGSKLTVNPSTGLLSASKLSVLEGEAGFGNTGVLKGVINLYPGVSDGYLGEINFIGLGGSDHTFKVSRDANAAWQVVRDGHVPSIKISDGGDIFLVGDNATITADTMFGSYINPNFTQGRVTIYPHFIADTPYPGFIDLVGPIGLSPATHRYFFLDKNDKGIRFHTAEPTTGLDGVYPAASMFINAASTSDAVDLATSEIAGTLAVGNGGTGNATGDATTLLGNTWAIPGDIGIATPKIVAGTTGSFTLTDTGASTGLAITRSSNTSSTVYGITSSLTTTRTGTGTEQAGYFSAIAGAAGFTGSLIGNQGRAVTGAGATVSNGYGISGNIDMTDAGVITNAQCLRAITTGTTGTCGTLYGLYVSDMTRGGTNYAIYTNSGDVRIGDDLSTVGDVTVSGGDVTIGVNGSVRGISVHEQGAGGNTPGASQFHSANGTAVYVSSAADGSIRSGTSVPTADGTNSFQTIDPAAPPHFTNLTAGTSLSAYGVCLFIDEHDATPDVSGGSRATVVTGWTAGHTITGFDGGHTGQILIILGGDSDCVIVDGANLSLAGNWTAAIGATLTVVLWDDGKWYETGRSAT
jgi:hypothetical protein